MPNLSPSFREQNLLFVQALGRQSGLEYPWRSLLDQLNQAMTDRGSIDRMIDED